MMKEWPVYQKIKDYIVTLLPEAKRNEAFTPELIFRQTSGAAVESKPARQELVVRLLSTGLGLTASFAFSYFAIKWLVNAMDPTYKQKKEAQRRAEQLMTKIGVKNVKLSEFELCIASNLVDPLSMVTSWDDIGGLEDTIEEIVETVILPFRHSDLFADSGLIQPPKGVLLYGPPGCGKTMIAKATAKAAGARFINLQVSSLSDKWYGESQKRAEAVFSLAVKLQPAIIFIDEIDSFLRSRNSTDHEATAMVKTQFMSFWDGLMTDPNCHVMIMGATNRPQDVDAAILRRMPSMFHIGLPNAFQRNKILQIILKDEPVDDMLQIEQLAAKTEGFCGSDLRELCRNAAIYRIREYVQSNDEHVTVQLRPISDNDFELALAKMKHGRKAASWATMAMQQADLD